MITKGDDLTVAQTIYEQLKAATISGWSFLDSIAAKSFVASKDSLTFKIAGTQPINTIVIRYDEGLDLYNVEFHNCRILEKYPYIINKKIDEVTGIYWDGLAELIARKVRS